MNLDLELELDIQILQSVIEMKWKTKGGNICLDQHLTASRPSTAPMAMTIGTKPPPPTPTSTTAYHHEHPAPNSWKAAIYAEIASQLFIQSENLQAKLNTGMGCMVLNHGPRSNAKFGQSLSHSQLSPNAVLSPNWARALKQFWYNVYIFVKSCSQTLHCLCYTYLLLIRSRDSLDGMVDAAV